MKQQYQNLNKQIYEQDYLSLDKTRCIKGLFSIIIVVSHLKNSTAIFYNSPIGKLMGLLAYLTVGGFFFFSGYGLSIQNRVKGREYVRYFHSDRLIPFYASCLFLALVNSVIFIFNDVLQPTAIWALKAILIPGYGITFGWYIQVIFIIYVLFWMLFLCFPRINRTVGYSIITALVLLFAVYLKKMLWWQSLLGFLLGCLWGEYKDQVDIVLRNGKITAGLLFFSVCGFLITTILGNANTIDGFWYAKVLKMISVPFFIVTLVLVVRWINLKNFLTEFLGKISLEIYCVHGIFLELFHSKWFYINNDLLYWGLNLLCTIFFACLIHPIVDFINKYVKKLLKESRGSGKEK
jgi:peptidoglycan/LPS O-acetylase OafA/YrhL